MILKSKTNFRKARARSNWNEKVLGCIQFGQALLLRHFPTYN